MKMSARNIVKGMRKSLTIWRKAGSFSAPSSMVRKQIFWSVGMWSMTGGRATFVSTRLGGGGGGGGGGGVEGVSGTAGGGGGGASGRGVALAVAVGGRGGLRGLRRLLGGRGGRGG